MKLVDFLDSYEGCVYLADTQFDVMGYVDDWTTLSWDCARLIRSLDRLVGGVSKVYYSNCLGGVVVSVKLGNVLDNEQAMNVVESYFPGADAWFKRTNEIVLMTMQALETEDDDVAVTLADCFDEIVDLGLHLG